MNEKEIEQYLIDFEKKELPVILHRDLNLNLSDKIKTIIGPRRVGKTYFLYQTMQEMRNKNKGILFFNFESTKFIELNFKDLKKIIELHKRLFKYKLNDKPVLFLDEPQNIDLWEIAARELFDENYNIFISGSSSKLLSKEISTTLRGRSLSYLLLPFSFKEFLRARNFKQDKLISTEERLVLLKYLDEYIEYGGYPEIVLDDNIEQKLKNLESYFDLTIYKDIMERHKIKDSNLIKWFLKSLASSYSKEFSINKIYLTLKSQGRKISKDELYLYSSFIEDSLFVFYLPKFSYSIRKREPVNKVYLCDVGFAKIIESNNEIGKKMENIVYLELLRRRQPNTEIFYWKNVQQEEVDFIIKKNEEISELIQVCKDINELETKKREIRSLLKASKDLRCKNLVIITEDYEFEEEVEWFDIKGKIKYKPIWKWLLE